jgi:zinc/manganese transport system substrate-binding protein
MNLNTVKAFTALIVICASWLWSTNAHATVRVVTTTTDLGEFVRTIGGNRVSVDTICSGTQDPHYVQARPSYMVKLSRADLLIAVGLELEVGWLPSLIQGARNPAINPGRRGYLDASSAIAPIDVPQGQVDRSQGDVHPLGNPHYWLDPDNAKLIASLISSRLTDLDSGGATLYRENLRAFNERIDQSMTRWTKAMSPLRSTKVVSYHKTFNYFLSRFNLVAVGYIEERPGIPPAAAHVAQLVRRMRSDGVRVIFHETYFDRATSDLASRRTGARVLVLPTSVGGVTSVENYEQLIDHLVNEFVSVMQAGEAKK